MANHSRFAVVMAAALAVGSVFRTTSATETWKLDLPTAPDLSVFGVEILLLYVGPPAGSTITNSSIDVTYQTDGEFSAQDLNLELYPLGPGGTWFLDGGDDFGWPDGPGTFTANLSTDQYNGLVTTELWEVAIRGEGFQVLGGAFLNESAFVFDYIPVPEPHAGLAALTLGVVSQLRRRRPHRGVTASR